MRLIFFIFFISTFIGHACDCSFNSKYELRNHSYNLSSYIVIGEITNIDDNNYHIKVFEKIKGDTINNKHLIGTINNSCSIIPKKGDVWLLYLEKNNEKETLYADMCLESKIIDYLYTGRQLKNELAEKENINSELNWLYQKKILEITKNNDSLRTNKDSIIIDEAEEDNYNIIITLLSAILLLQIVNLFKKRY